MKVIRINYGPKREEMNNALNQSNKNFWYWQGHKVSWTLYDSNTESSIATLMVHGFGACKEHFRYNQSIIGQIGPCFSIDLIGFGESSQPKSCLNVEKKLEDSFIYCFDNWSQQIIDFCNEIVKKPVIIIGNSIGGVIALKASQGLRFECKGLILINCAQRRMDDKRLSEQSFFMKVSRPILKNIVQKRWLSETLFKNLARKSFIKSVLEMAYPTKSNINQELIDMLYNPTQREGSTEAFRGFINLFDDYLAPHLMKNIDIPIDLIWGEKDPWESLEEAKVWLNSYKCVRSLEIIPNSGHCPHDEKPEIVNPLLIKIIQEAM